MAVIAVPHNEPWIVARWAFRMLADRASTQLADAEDRYRLEQAVALDGLHFDLLDVEQGRRLALALESAATELRSELLAGDQSDPRDGEFADMLAILAINLRVLFE